MSDYQFADSLRITIQPNGVLIATLNRPDRLNAFDGTMRHAIHEFLHKVRDDDDIRAIVLTGAGGNFCSGADLTAEDRRRWPTGKNEPLFAWCVELLQMPKPTIAALDGVAAGGGLGMALLCDIRICSTRTRLIPIWTKRAIHPDDLVTWTLPRLVGYSRALTWLYLAEDIPIQSALDTGLVLQACSSDTLMDEALALADRLAAGPTKHFALTKKAVLDGLTRDPKDSAVMEAWAQSQALASNDFKEGIAAFREKRPPKFSGD